MLANKVYLVLLSGGIDSTIAALKIIERKDCARMIPVFINYGQKSLEQEWNSVLKVAKNIKRLYGDSIEEFESPVRIDLGSKNGFGIFNWSKSKLITGNRGASDYVENRNMILISIVASYAESVKRGDEQAVIVTGFRNEWEDTSPKFVDAMNGVFKVLKTGVRVEAPVIQFKDKNELLKAHEKYRQFFDLTWSCYTPLNGKPCGNCSACILRQKALESN